MDFKEKIVTRGWEGEDMVAREFPTELAVLSLQLQRTANEEYPNQFLTMSCIDVILNFLKGEDTYIASFMWGQVVEEVLRLAQKTK